MTVKDILYVKLILFLEITNVLFGSVDFYWQVYQVKSNIDKLSTSVESTGNVINWASANEVSLS